MYLLPSFKSLDQWFSTCGLWICGGPRTTSMGEQKLKKKKKFIAAMQLFSKYAPFKECRALQANLYMCPNKEGSKSPSYENRGLNRIITITKTD